MNKRLKPYEAPFQLHPAVRIAGITVFALTLLAVMILFGTASSRAAPPEETPTVHFGVRPGCTVPPGQYTDATERRCFWIDNEPSAVCLYKRSSLFADEEGARWGCLVALIQDHCKAPWSPVKMQCQLVHWDGTLTKDQEVDNGSFQL